MGQQQAPEWVKQAVEALTSMSGQVVSQTSEPFTIACTMSKEGVFVLTMTNGGTIINVPGKVELSPIVRAAVAPPVNGHASRFKLAQPDEG